MGELICKNNLFFSWDSRKTKTALGQPSPTVGICLHDLDFSPPLAHLSLHK